MLIPIIGPVFDDSPCAERRQLERAVIVAVEVLYAAKGGDRTPARITENEAVTALNAHVKEHGCKR
jgi:hypothetical protein